MGQLLKKSLKKEKCYECKQEITKYSIQSKKVA